MQVHKPSCVGFGCRPIRYRGRQALSLSATLYFPFRDVAPFGLWSEASMWSFLAREMPEPLIDEGIVKTRPEYLVSAVAHPPKKPSTSCAVRARVGALEKTLVAHGDRFWNGRQPSAAKPFDAMPLGWDRAYGGPDHPDNPLGCGRPMPRGPQLLPNIEYPQAPSVDPGKDIPVAGFGRIDPTWPERARHRGTYDERWMIDHAPGFAPDLDWRHFNMAAPDQWFAGALTGHETFSFDHLHPDKPTVGGRLPGLTVKCVLHYLSGPHAGKLRSVALNLTTLWFFPHAERVVAIHQALADCTEDDAADVGMVMVAVERQGEPRPDEHYELVRAKREDAKLGALYALVDSDLTPAGLDLHDPDMAAVEADFKVEGFVGDAQHRGATIKVDQARDRVRSLGLDPDLLGVRMPAREPVPSLSELPAYVERQIIESAEHGKRALFESAKDVVKANEIARANGIDPKALLPKGPPTFQAASELQKLATASAQDADPRAAARRLLDLAPRLAQAEAALRMAYVQAAHLQEPAPAMSPTVAAQHRDEVLAWLRSGKSLAWMNLTGADLSGLDLSNLDLQGAQMESANLTDTLLVGANLSHAVMAHACLEGADFSRAVLVGANLGTQRMKGARFDEADLSAALLSCAKLDGVSFRKAKLAGAQFLETTFGHCDWRGAQAREIILMQRSLAGLTADGADLSDANFIECSLVGASFVGARLRGANFIQCDSAGTRFANAQLSRAVFAQGCKLDGCDFQSADLMQANLRGASLTGALLRGARIDQSDLSEADLSGADLEEASLQGVLAIRTVLRAVRARRSNWMQAVASKADLRAADLTLANLHGADFAQVWLDADTRLERCNADRLKTHPRRRPSEQGAPT